MVTLAQIPVDISPARLSAAAGLTLEEAGDFLEQASPALAPAGVFDEVEPGVVSTADGLNPAGEITVIIGLCGLGPEVSEVFQDRGRDSLWTVLAGLALRDVLDYVEYRVRLFLRAVGRLPGERLLSDCPELPLNTVRAVFQHFEPVKSLGLIILPSGEIDCRTGLAFLYTTALKPENKAARCAGCSRQDCLSRQ